MNSEVRVGDGFGGLVIITEVNPFKLVDDEVEQDGTCTEVYVPKVDDKLVDVVEVNIDYDDAASHNFSDDEFLGFREEEVADARVFAEVNSSIGREWMRKRSPRTPRKRSPRAEQLPEGTPKSLRRSLKIPENFIKRESSPGLYDAQDGGVYNSKETSNHHGGKVLRRTAKKTIPEQNSADRAGTGIREKIISAGSADTCKYGGIGDNLVRGRADRSLADGGHSLNGSASGFVDGGMSVPHNGSNIRVELSLVKTENLESDAGLRGVGSSEKIKKVAFKNKRKSSNVRKHPLYAKDDALNDVTNPLSLNPPIVKIEITSKCQNCRSPTETSADLKRSSRVRKIPAKLQGDVLTNVSWIKTEPSSSSGDSPEDAETTTGSMLSGKTHVESGVASLPQQQVVAEENHVQIASTFTIAESNHSVTTSPAESRTLRKTTPCLYTENFSDSDYHPGNTDDERNSTNSAQRNKKTPAKGNRSSLKDHSKNPILNGDRGSTVNSSDVGNSKDKPWRCELCPYKTASEASLKTHTRAHTKSSYKCQECPYLAVSKTGLVIHKRKHTGEKPYKCTSCEYSCSTRSALKGHVRLHIGDKPFTCDHCKKTFVTKSHLNIHMSTHTGDKPFFCKICGYKTALSGHLLRHMATHSGEKKFNCHQCKFSTSRRIILENHMEVHEGGKVHRCTECNFSADFALILKRHMYEHAVDDFSYKCPYCDFTTALPAAMRDHVRTHAVENPKPFLCIICKYANMDLHHMRLHMRTHGDEKPFKCTKCSYSSSTIHNLRRHMDSHSDERPYVCSGCPKKYWDKYSLKYHKQTCKRLKGKKVVDDEPKKYICLKCNFATQYFTQLNIHRKTHSDNSQLHCSDCDFVTNSRTHFTMHMRKHSEKLPYKCDLCDFATANTIVLKAHKVGHKELWQFSCDECNEKFRLKIHLDYHKEKGCELAGLPLKPVKNEDPNLSCEEEDGDVPSRKTLKKKRKSGRTKSVGRRTK